MRSKPPLGARNHCEDWQISEGLRARDTFGRQHARIAHDPQNARNADAHGELVKTQCLACLVQQNRCAAIRGLAAQAALAQGRIQDHGRAKSMRHPRRAAVMRRDTNLGQVGAVHRGRVQIDAKITSHHHVVEKNMCQPCPQRSTRRAGKTAVQVAPVRQISRPGQKSETVDNGHHKQSAAQGFQLGRPQQPAHDLNADDLVAMHRCRDEHRGTIAARMHNLDAQVDGGVIGHGRHRERDRRTCAGRDPLRSDCKGCPRHHKSLSC